MEKWIVRGYNTKTLFIISSIKILTKTKTLNKNPSHRNFFWREYELICGEINLRRTLFISPTFLTQNHNLVFISLKLKLPLISLAFDLNFWRDNHYFFHIKALYRSPQSIKANPCTIVNWGGRENIPWTSLIHFSLPWPPNKRRTPPLFSLWLLLHNHTILITN